MYDSSGTLSVMPHFRVPLSATWIRILQTGRIAQGMGGSKSYWPVGVMGDMFFCLILKGQQAFPGFPRPLLQQLSVRLPLRQTESDQARLQEQ